MDGNSTMEGRVELCTQGLWGAIITSGWSSSDAVVACKQLGLPWECELDTWCMGHYTALMCVTLILLKGAIPDTSNIFGQGTSRIVARYFGCTGAETHLTSCSYSAISLSSGTNYQTYTPAGVICQGVNASRPTQRHHGDARLANGLMETEGRVEVCTCAYGYWAMACDSYSYWNIAATHLVCKQLGLPMERMCILYSNNDVYSTNNSIYICHHIQYQSFYLVVHLDPTISCLLLDFPVVVEPVMSVNAKSTIRLAIAAIEEQLVYSAKVNHCY